MEAPPSALRAAIADHHLRRPIAIVVQPTRAPSATHTGAHRTPQAYILIGRRWTCSSCPCRLGVLERETGSFVSRWRCFISAELRAGSDMATSRSLSGRSSGSLLSCRRGEHPGNTSGAGLAILLRGRAAQGIGIPEIPGLFGAIAVWVTTICHRFSCPTGPRADHKSFRTVPRLVGNDRSPTRLRLLSSAGSSC